MDTGTFVLQEKSFIMNGRKAVIRQRKKPGGKPELFLIELQPFKYISSLFPGEEPGVYTFDTESQLFKLKLKDSQVEISRVETDKEGQK